MAYEDLHPAMILAIESSCDESAVALFERGLGLRGEWVSSQVSLHAEYGGVVPDLASREHLACLGPLLGEAAKAVDLREIDEVVVTTGPGLAGCLAMGLAAGNALAAACEARLYGANHLRAHVHSVFIDAYERDPAGFGARLEGMLPHLGLVVSGGNTLLCRVERDRSLALLGGTIDDAAGEALDKGAKLLGLGYPGGPKLERWAQGGQPGAFDFPRALMDRPTLDFSFSGLKTSLRYLLDKLGPAEAERRRADLCAAYQAAVVDALAGKVAQALRAPGYRSAGLSGGVANNAALRERFEGLAEEAGIPPLLARPEHTGDNAAMIAFTHVFEPPPQSPPEPLDLHPRLRIDAR